MASVLKDRKRRENANEEDSEPCWSVDSRAWLELMLLPLTGRALIFSSM